MATTNHIRPLSRHSQRRAIAVYKKSVYRLPIPLSPPPETIRKIGMELSTSAAGQPQPDNPLPLLHEQVAGTSTPIPARLSATSQGAAEGGIDMLGRALVDTSTSAAGLPQPDKPWHEQVAGTSSPILARPPATSQGAAEAQSLDDSGTVGDADPGQDPTMLAAVVEPVAAATEKKKKDWHVVLGTLKGQLSDLFGKHKAAQRRILSFDDTMEELARRAETASADKKATGAALQLAS